MNKSFYSILSLFFSAFVSMQFAAGKVILEEGGTYEQGCPLTLSGNSNQMIQFVKEKTVIKMFNSEYTIPGHLISNDTEVDTAITNATNRYTVYKASGGSGDLVLRITGKDLHCNLRVFIEVRISKLSTFIRPPPLYMKRHTENIQ